MKHPGTRNTTSYGADSNGFAKYYSPEHSIDDIILYLRYFDYPKRYKSIAEVITTMKQNRYFEEKFEVYLNGVKAFNQIL